MPYFTYDTSVMISRRPLDLLLKTKGIALSSVVLLELMASAADNSSRKLYEDLFLTYSRDNELIVPNEADWLFASKILYWLSRRRRRTDGWQIATSRSGNVSANGSRRSYRCKRATVGSGSGDRKLGTLQSDSIFLRRQADQGFGFLSVIGCAWVRVEKFFLSRRLICYKAAT